MDAWQSPDGQNHYGDFRHMFLNFYQKQESLMEARCGASLFKLLIVQAAIVARTSTYRFKANLCTHFFGQFSVPDRKLRPSIKNTDSEMPSFVEKLRAQADHQPTVHPSRLPRAFTQKIVNRF